MIYLLQTKYNQTVIIKSITNDDNSISQSIIEKDTEPYQAYLAWVALGNTPQPADEVTV